MTAHDDSDSDYPSIEATIEKEVTIYFQVSLGTLRTILQTMKNCDEEVLRLLPNGTPERVANIIKALSDIEERAAR